ncbi:hypothetical protein M405DRAFT_932047 [Rhizopogon salebrosus TDB-379]|nr:hypothetical protein M405DRAFT_932047 [Rhizopogon salebrosus TDB-379]
MSVTTPQMPFRRELAAPIFNPTRPRSLLRYFEDLEEHFARCCIDDLDARKRWTLRYAPIEAADLWEYLPGWTSATDWAAVKRNVAARYPACDYEHRYTFADFTSLIDSQASQEFSSIAQWSEFLNQYLVISQYLIARHRLDPLEQQRYLLRSLSPSLRLQVESYTYQIDPRRDPDHIMSVVEVDTAVTYCLRTPELPHSMLTKPLVDESDRSRSPKTVEQLSALVAKLVQKELTKLEYQSSPSLPVITPALAIAPARLSFAPRRLASDNNFAHSPVPLRSHVTQVEVPLASRRASAQMVRSSAMSRMVYPPPGLPPPKAKKPESDNRGTASLAFDQLFDAPITIPLRNLVAPRSKRVLPGEDLRIVEPRQQATMTTKIEYSLPRQESQSRVPVAVFTLSQVLEAPLSCVEEDRVPKSKPQVPVIESPDLVQSSIASKLRPEPAKTKIEVTPVSPSSSQNQVPHISSALVPLVSNIDRTPHHPNLPCTRIIPHTTAVLAVLRQVALAPEASSSLSKSIAPSCEVSTPSVGVLTQSS